MEFNYKSRFFGISILFSPRINSIYKLIDGFRNLLHKQFLSISLLHTARNCAETFSRLLPHRKHRRSSGKFLYFSTHTRELSSYRTDYSPTLMFHDDYDTVF